MNIVVLAGGLSTERDISLSSAFQIHDALIDRGHKVVMLDAYLGLTEEIDDIEKVFSDVKLGAYVIPETPPTLDNIKREKANTSEGYWGINVLKICKYADVVFIALHGADGENGKVQATFDLLGIAYTGTGYLGSALALNKHLSKQIMEQNHILTPKWKIINRAKVRDEPKVNLPLVVKPVHEGSSVGVNVAYSIEEYKKALAEAFYYGESVLVEEYIEGREFSVGILRGIPLPPIEIVPNDNFFDYKNKYQANCTKEICPAVLPIDKTKEIQDIAVKVHHILQLGTYSRVDFIYKDGAFYCLEANALPGMTPESLLPKEALVYGYSFSELCNELVEGAMKDQQ